MRKIIFFFIPILILISLTACYRPVESQKNVVLDSLSTLIEQLQLRVEEFTWAQAQNQVDIKKNAKAIEELKVATQKNSDFADSLYSSITYSAIFQNGIELTQINSVPTMEEIKSLIETQNRKSLDEFEKTFNAQHVNAPGVDETEKLRREISTLQENYKTLKWQLYKNESESLSKETYPVYEGSVIYTIQSGDTLSAIANAFGLGNNGAEEIMKINSIQDARSIRSGQTIKIDCPSISEMIRIPLHGKKRLIPDDIIAFYAQSTQEGFSRGLSFSTAQDQMISSCLPGKIIDKGASYVVIYHGNDMKLIYSNLQNIIVNKGEWVTAEQIIGCAYQNEFRLEFILGSEYRDPMNLFLEQMGQFRITFYTEWEDGNLPYFPYFRRVKDGSFAREWYSVAADPELFEKGTMIYIPELKNTPSRGLFVVEDEGSAIKGNSIDVYIRDLTLASKLQTTSAVFRFP